jgi:hypothetical protein
MVWFLHELKETFNNLDSAVSLTRLNSNNSYNNESINANNIQTSHEIDSEYDDGDDAGDYEIKVDNKKYTSLVKRETRGETNRKEKLKSYQIFYLNYGACSLVWFIYLPVLIFITSFVTELYRLRLVLSIHNISFIIIIKIIIITIIF